MMTRTIEQIVEALKSGEEPSRVLDCEIHLAVVGNPEFGWKGMPNHRVAAHLDEYLSAFRSVIDADDAIPDEVVPRYTASMDAALRLLPGGCYWLIGNGRAGGIEPLGGCMVFRPDNADDPMVETEAGNALMALLLAALEARQELAPIFADKGRFQELIREMRRPDIGDEADCITEADIVSDLAEPGWPESGEWLGIYSRLHEGGELTPRERERALAYYRTDDGQDVPPQFRLG